MTFHSILFDSPKDDITENVIPAPACFSDLNLDQIVNAITGGRDEYHLKPFFYYTLDTIDAIRYRHEIFQDLGDDPCHDAVRKFSEKMQAMRKHLIEAGRIRNQHQKDRWFLDAVELYYEAVEGLVTDLTPLGLKSPGFWGFLAYLTDYSRSGTFTSLVAEVKSLKAELSWVQYCLLIDGNVITVKKVESDEVSITEVERTFERFNLETRNPHKENCWELPEMNHVEARILDLVAKLHPDTFLHLNNFQKEHTDYLDKTIARFDREIQFYMAYLEYIEKFKSAGLSFCIPRISETSKEIGCSEGFDLALAKTLVEYRKPIVCNDFYLKEKERIFVITGPNQGGKTTFARAFGQLHYLAGLGCCPVPGKEARLFLFDRIFTHFEKEEDLNTLRSKLEDDLVRIHSILTQSTSRSIIIINEMFTSTTVQDALFLGRKILGQIAESDMLCVYVTFLDELTALEKTVSLVGTVNPDNPDLRTFKLERRPADGRSYATAVIRKNRLTYTDIRKRMNP